MATLKTPAHRPAVVYSNDQLLIVGDTGSSGTCKDVQYLNLASNTTGVYARTTDCGQNLGVSYPGMYNIESCIQQTSPATNLNSEWECLTSSESALEGLGFDSDGSSYYIRYSNFVV